ncbi:hypothetical protein [Caldisericum sp.]|uniref:hypothetical protein n=1 Tax=Caldisericum sp. TaxID=2499687 RepID=UPI003D13B101
MENKIKTCKRGMFLLGVLTKMLIDRQVIQEVPCFKLDNFEETVRSFLLQLQKQKLQSEEELLLVEITKCLLKAGEWWETSTSFLNFCFISGVILGKQK